MGFGLTCSFLSEQVAYFKTPKLNITWYTFALIVSHVIWHPCHMSFDIHVTCHLTSVSRHLTSVSHVIWHPCHMSFGIRVTCHLTSVSHVIWHLCHMSFDIRVACHLTSVSHIMWHVTKPCLLLIAAHKMSLSSSKSILLHAYLIQSVKAIEKLCKRVEEMVDCICV